MVLLFSDCFGLRPFVLNGVKVGVVSTNKESFVVGMKSLLGNPYDGHTLAASLDQARRLSGVAPKEAYVDR